MTASGRTVRLKSLLASTVVAALATLGLELVNAAFLPSPSRRAKPLAGSAGR